MAGAGAAPKPPAAAAGAAGAEEPPKEKPPPDGAAGAGVEDGAAALPKPNAAPPAADGAEGVGSVGAGVDPKENAAPPAGLGAAGAELNDGADRAGSAAEGAGAPDAGVDPNRPDAGPPAGATGAGAPPNAKEGLLASAVLSAAGAGAPPNENPAVPGAAAPAFPAGADSDGVPLPNENMVFLLDGSDEDDSSFFADDGAGALPNENPGIDAPPFFSGAASLDAVAPKANPAPPLGAPPSSFFSSPPPKLNPAPEVDDAFLVDGGAAGAPNRPPVDGAADEASSLSRPRFALAGVAAGAEVAPPKENPPPAGAEAAGAAADAPPNEKPPAPMPALPVSSLPRLALAGVAELLVALFAFSLACSKDAAAALAAFDAEDLVDDDDGAPPKENPPAPMLAEAAGVAAAPPNEKPPAPMLPLASFLAGSVFLLVSPPAPPGLIASHAKHLPASGGLGHEHTLHFHSPGLDLKMSPHPPAAGGAFDALSAAGAGDLAGLLVVVSFGLSAPKL